MKARYICTLSHAKKLVILLWIVSFILALPIIKGQVSMHHSVAAHGQASGICGLTPPPPVNCG